MRVERREWSGRAMRQNKQRQSPADSRDRAFDGNNNSTTIIMLAGAHSWHGRIHAVIDRAGDISASLGGQEGNMDKQRGSAITVHRAGVSTMHGAGSRPTDWKHHRLTVQTCLWLVCCVGCALMERERRRRGQ